MKISDVEEFIRRFVILPEPAYLPMALWVISTFTPDAFDCLPYLAIQSPTKRCGKSRALEVLKLLCRRPWLGTALTPAVLFRMMESQPTLLLDEIEGLKWGRGETAQAILAVLNVGHRKGESVARCSGDGLVFYPTYCPKAFATIHDLPDTLQDRSIVVKMERKRKDQETERFLSAAAKAEAVPVADAAEKWAKENEEAIRVSYETIADVPFLIDREADLWRPLFALCEVLAPERMDDLRWSARHLSAAKEGLDESRSIGLLEAARAVWPKNVAAISTADLIDRLKNLKEWRTTEITPRLLGNWLRPFGVAPKQIRLGETTCKGYARDAFRIAWTRFLGTRGTSEVEEELVAA